MAKRLKAPFVYFGGKSKVADEVWRRFGAVNNYIEPFCGSAAVLLANPNQCIETINDANGWLVNFWRAVQKDPIAVAHHATHPVIELDLHARNDFMVAKNDGFAEKLRADPYFFDVEMAGWWVWGKAISIASSWGEGGNRSIPNLSGGNGIKGQAAQPMTDWFGDLCDRLSERTRIVCGDWSRVLTPIVTTQGFGLTAVFLDPPYGSTDETKRSMVYANDSLTVAGDVRKWCIENGSNPLFRIALCGYDEHNEMLDHGWSQYNWKATGGYGNQNKKRENTNARKECIWFSPHCINKDLFHGLEDGDE